MVNTETTSQSSDETGTILEPKIKKTRRKSTKTKSTTPKEEPIAAPIEVSAPPPELYTPPSLEEFAQIISPAIEFEHFHSVYYKLLESFAHGQIRKLIITMPPQHGKSLGATNILPAYMLGLNPDLRIAIASYSSSLASKFNRRVQRILESKEYNEIFPETTIKKGAKPANYIRTSEEVEIIDHDGSLLSVGREGALTGNRVDCFILDDLYKDAMEANSPLIRENCLEWYTSVVKTRMHNTSSELIVFTRWHEEDLIGTLTQRELYKPFFDFDQLESTPAEG